MGLQLPEGLLHRRVAAVRGEQHGLPERRNAGSVPAVAGHASAGVPSSSENRRQRRITEEQCGFIDVVEGTGKLTPQEFDQAVYDSANFLYYVAEPARFERERLGIYVLLFLVVLYVFTALLGREYNKEVH